MASFIGLRYEPTYKGLKPNQLYTIAQAIYRYEPTYKGLKRYPPLRGSLFAPCYEPTYKGLKRNLFLPLLGTRYFHRR